MSSPDAAAAPRTGIARTARSRRTRAALVAAVRSELRATGSFTAELVAERAGCSPATFYSHFATKDDALAAAFEVVLGDLVSQAEVHFTLDVVRARGVGQTVRDLVEHQATFFRTESLVFRAALARLPEHRGLRDAYRNAEAANLAHLKSVVSDAQNLGLIRPGSPDVLAEAVMVLAQGINNPRLLRPEAAGLRAEVAIAITAVLAPES